MGVSAYHILRKRELKFFKVSFRMAAAFGLVSAILVAVVGDFHGSGVARTQPTKLAAMESVWETQRGAPMNLLVVPDPGNERNSVEAVGIPKLLSFLSYRDWDAEVKGLKDFPREDRPPVLLTFASFRLMIGLGMLFILLSLLGYFYARRDRLESVPGYLKLMLYVIPLPYIATQLGWIVAEVGRQPWIVYGVLRTEDAVSRAITLPQVWGSLIGFTLLYGFLGVVDIYLLAKFSKKGPA
jgi:cytochrome d ubiquinol oxidase subunit I